MSAIHTIEVRTPSREALLDLSAQVQAAVRTSGVHTGLVCVYCPHTTAGITVQENADPDVQLDLLAHLATLVPSTTRFRHAEGNSDAHVKASLVGTATTIPVDEGRALLGRWQGIYFCEFDGPRTRTVHIKVLAG